MLWQRVWRDGFAPLITPEGLAALRDALERDDPRLVQRATTWPVPIPLFANASVEAACAVGFSLWRGEPTKVSDLDLRFRRLCASADDLLDEPLASFAFLNWFDETPRAEMRQLLLEEIERTLPRSARAA